METLHRIDLLEPLVLTDLTPITAGKERLVFAHPVAPGLIVKVVRPDRRRAREKADRSWFRRRVRVRHYTLFLREIREYLALRARVPEGKLPLARLLGLVETDLGLGLVSERIESPAGSLAPTLAQLLATTHDRKPLHRAIDRLCEDLLRLNVVVNDLNAGNLVACTATDGDLRFVLVDGFGDKNLFPLRSMLLSLNRRNTRKRIAILHEFVARTPATCDVLVGAPAC